MKTTAMTSSTAETSSGRTSAARRAIFTTSSISAAEVADRCGDNCYSYYFVQRAFLPLLQRWAPVEEVTQSPRKLRETIAAAQHAGHAPIYLSFLPLQYARPVPGVPNIAFPFWEYPDIPHYDVAGNPRNNWVRAAADFDMLLTACRFTRDAFNRAGVETPLHVTPVPIADPYFTVPPWEPLQRMTLDCASYVLPQGDPQPLSDLARIAANRASVKLREQCRLAYRRGVRPLLPQALHRRLAGASHATIGKEPPPVTLTHEQRLPIPYAVSGQLDLSGVVYTTILNPFDIRKNWQGIVAAFLAGLGDCDDATLVVKLAAAKNMRREALHNVLHFYRRLRIRHRAKVVVLADFLADEQMYALTQASTFYLNASHAEGACLPLQDALAAGRPGVAPAHTAMGEYIDERVAFVVPSHPERTHWQWDPEQRPSTTWNQIQRRPLAAQLRSSYHVAKHDLGRYRQMSSEGRLRMRDLASTEQVWQRLSAALDSLKFVGRVGEMKAA
jgi:glycosyltransferase involved in cell wall biosynthesis